MSSGEYYFKEGCFILEMLNSEMDPSVSVARARVEPGVRTRRHQLTGIAERYIILQGEGRVQVGEAAQQTVTVGDSVHIPPSVDQCIENTGTSDLVFLAVCTPRFQQEAYRDTEGQ